MDWMPMIVQGAVAGLIAWGGLSVELRYMRRDIRRGQRSADAAHWRLDQLKAPPLPFHRGEGEP